MEGLSQVFKTEWAKFVVTNFWVYKYLLAIYLLKGGHVLRERKINKVQN